MKFMENFLVVLFFVVIGFVLYNLGNIPSVGDSFMHENYRFEITEMKNVRIEQIKITKTRVIKNLK